MAYSTVDDLIVGDMMISARVDKNKFVNDAAEEIDSKLGFLYVLPLAPLALHESTLLKQINNKLASGRLILTLDIAGEETVLHAYGLRLITEAMNDLMLLANGTINLSSTMTTTSALRDNVPGIYNHDEESAVDIFEAHVLRGEPSYWNPGTVKSRYQWDYYGRPRGQ